MWFLIQEPSGSKCPVGIQTKTAKWGLLPGCEYTVGKYMCDITLTDASVSKLHAKLTVAQIENSPPDALPEVVMEDLGSNFGTFTNDGILDSTITIKEYNKGTPGRQLSKPTILKDNDRIRFGPLHSIFRLKWIQLEVTSSMLKDSKPVSKWLMDISGTQIQQSWSPSTTHLVMTSIQLSPKVLNCLAGAVPIVLPEYFKDFLSSLQSKQSIPDPDSYVPKVSDAETEVLMRHPDVSFRINENRRSLFKGKVFMFLTEAVRKELNTPIQLAGGSTATWSHTDKARLDSPDILLVKPRRSKTQDNTVDQELQSLTQYLEERSRAVVLVTQIYMAIVYCNFNKCANIREPCNVLPAVAPLPRTGTSTVRAADTQVISTPGIRSMTSQRTSSPPSSSAPQQSLGGRTTNQKKEPSSSSVTNKRAELPLRGVEHKDKKQPETVSDIFKATGSTARGSQEEEAFRTLQYSPTQASAPYTNTSQDNSEDIMYCTVSTQKDGYVAHEKKRALSSDSEDSQPQSKKPHAGRGNPPPLFQKPNADSANPLPPFQKPNADSANPLPPFQKPNADSGNHPPPFKKPNKDYENPPPMFENPNKTPVINSKGGFRVLQKSAESRTSEQDRRTDRQSTQSEEDLDIFGFGGSDRKGANRNRFKRKAEEAEEDIFNFGESEYSKKKKTVEGGRAQAGQKIIESGGERAKEEKVGSTDRQGTDSTASGATDKQGTDSTASGATDRQGTVSTASGAMDRQDNRAEKSFDSTRSRYKNTTMDNTGFLSKSTIRVKKEPIGDGDVSKLSDELCNIVVAKLFRDKEPIYRPDKSVISDGSNSSQMGVKRFRKQMIKKPLSKVRLTVSKANFDGDRSIDQWFKQNPDVTLNLQKEKRNTENAENFWLFHESQTQKKPAGKHGRV